MSRQANANTHLYHNCLANKISTPLIETLTDQGKIPSLILTLSILFGALGQLAGFCVILFLIVLFCGSVGVRLRLTPTYSSTYSLILSQPRKLVRKPPTNLTINPAVKFITLFKINISPQLLTSRTKI